MKSTVPSEDYECKRFADWLGDNQYKFSHLAQSTFTRSVSVKWKLQQMGVKKGVPDYIICLKRKPILFFLEMKRRRGGRVSPEQTEWIKAINEHGARAVICYGFDDAKMAVLQAEVGPHPETP